MLFSVQAHYGFISRRELHSDKIKKRECLIDIYGISSAVKRRCRDTRWMNFIV